MTPHPHYSITPPCLPLLSSTDDLGGIQLISIYLIRLYLLYSGGAADIGFSGSVWRWGLGSPPGGFLLAPAWT